MRSCTAQENHQLTVKAPNLHLPGALDFISHDTVDLAGLDIDQQTLQRGALHVSAGEAAIVVAFG
jgi:hypothetical protein